MNKQLLKEFNSLGYLVEKCGYGIDVQHTFSLHNDDTNTYDIVLSSPYKRWKSIYSLKNNTLLGGLVGLEIEAGNIINEITEGDLQK